MAGVRSDTLVGRDRELASLGEFLSAAQAGRGAILVVSGEAGIGKSRLATEAIERARAANIVVSRGRALSSRQSAFRPLAEALAGTLLERRIVQAPEIVPFVGVLRRVLLPASSGPASTPGGAEIKTAAAGQSTSAIVAEGVRRLLRKVGEGRGVLVVLEDVHWADVETLEVVDRLADEVVNDPIVMVMTQRTDHPGPTSDMVAELVARRVVNHLPLKRLTPAEVTELARRALHAEVVPSALQDALDTRAEGVPFLIEELVSTFASMGGAPDAGLDMAASSHIADSISPSYRAIVADRLARLDPSARRTVEAASLIGRQFDRSLIGVALLLDDVTVLAGLRAAVAQRLIGEAAGSHLGGFAFRHALAREAVLADMLGPDRATLALAVADAIEDGYPGLPGDWCERAATLRDEAGDRLGAVRLLHESATRALGRGAFASAESALLRAHELAEGDPMAWVGIDELLAQVYRRSGRTDRLVALVERVVGLYDHYRSLGGRLARPARLAELHLMVARSGLATGDVDLVRARLAEIADIVDDETPEAIEAQIVGAWLALHESTPGSASALGSTLAAVRTAAGRTGRAHLEAEALAVSAAAARRAGAVEDARDHIEALIGVADRAGLATQKVDALLELGRVEEARGLALDIGAMAPLVRCDLELATASLDRGQLGQAAATIDRAIDLAPKVAPALIPDVRLLQAELDGMTGRGTDMERHIELAIGSVGQERDRTRVVALAFGDVRATAALLRGDRSAAIAAYDKALEIPDDRTDVAAARWAAMRHLTSGEKAVTPPTDDAVTRALWAYGMACIFGGRGRADRAIASFESAESLMPAGWRRECARVTVAEAAITDHWGTPGAWAAAAAAWFAEAGLGPAAAHARRVMRHAGVPVGRRGRGDAEVPADLRAAGVTSREMDVLLLVGHGLSNVAIGERLFISARTVESHVASLIRKTGLQARGELVALGARRLARAEAEPSRVG